MPDTGSGTGPCDVPRLEGPGGGPINWEVKRNRDGTRDYTVTYRVRVNPGVHGPARALNCPGLPEEGSLWTEFGNTPDLAAYFTAETDVRPDGKATNNELYLVTRHATSGANGDCISSGHDDPLTIIDRVKVESVTYTVEANEDRFGSPMINSAFEQYRGKEVEYDAHRLRVTIEQNAASLDLPLVNSLMHHLNDADMWGFSPRHIKLSHFDGEPKYHFNCQKYWLRRFVFDIANDFDRCLLDEGTRAIRGAWDKNPSSPTYGQYVVAKIFIPFLGMVDVPATNQRSMIRYKDWHGENTRVILNGHGRPWDSDGLTTGTDDDTMGRNCFEYYENGNLLLLGIPLSLE